MTFQVRKSLLASTDLFDIEVAAFAHERRNWLAHMARVEQDRKNNVTGIERHDPHPAPTAHELIMSAVDETGRPDYEYLDDLPTAEQRLAEKKRQLQECLILSQREAEDAVLSAAKQRLAGIRLSDISRADIERHRKVHSKYVGLLQKLKIKDVDHKAMADEVKGMRPDKDNDFLDDHAKKAAAIESISRKTAQALSDIEDLTIETIDTWQAPEF